MFAMLFINPMLKVCSVFMHCDCFNDHLFLANAWEEGDEVVLITCRLENPDLDMVNGAVKEKLENFTNELYENCEQFFIL